MARPAPLIDRRDRFRVVEEDKTPDDLSPAEPGDDDGDAVAALARERRGEMVEAEPAAAIHGDSALAPDMAEFAAIQPEPMAETGASPERQDGGMSILSLAVIALVAAGLSAAVVLYLF